MKTIEIFFQKFFIRMKLFWKFLDNSQVKGRFFFVFKCSLFTKGYNLKISINASFKNEETVLKTEDSCCSTNSKITKFSKVRIYEQRQIEKSFKFLKNSNNQVLALCLRSRIQHTLPFQFNSRSLFLCFRFYISYIFTFLEELWIKSQ